jgi:hypothetical protein
LGEPCFVGTHQRAQRHLIVSSVETRGMKHTRPYCYCAHLPSTR